MAYGNTNAERFLNAFSEIEEKLAQQQQRQQQQKRREKPNDWAPFSDLLAEHHGTGRKHLLSAEFWATFVIPGCRSKYRVRSPALDEMTGFSGCVESTQPLGCRFGTPVIVPLFASVAIRIIGLREPLMVLPAKRRGKTC